MGKFPAIMPDLSKWKRQGVKEISSKKNTEDIRTRLEFLLEETPPEKARSTDSDSPQENPTHLTPLQQKIWEYLKGKSPRTTRQIKKSSDKFKDDSEPQIKEALDELIRQELVKFDADTGGYFAEDL
jgi:predicted HTH transcriptional regulator